MKFYLTLPFLIPLLEKLMQKKVYDIFEIET